MTFGLHASTASSTPSPRPASPAGQTRANRARVARSAARTAAGGTVFPPAGRLSIGPMRRCGHWSNRPSPPPSPGVSWRLLRKLRCSTTRITNLVQAVLTLVRVRPMHRPCQDDSRLTTHDSRLTAAAGRPYCPFGLVTCCRWHRCPTGPSRACDASGPIRRTGVSPVIRAGQGGECDGHTRGHCAGSEHFCISRWRGALPGRPGAAQARASRRCDRNPAIARTPIPIACSSAAKSGEWGTPLMPASGLATPR